MPSTYLTRTPSSAGNRKTWTISAWIKRTELSSSDWIIRASGGGDAGGFYFPTDNKLAINLENSGGNIINLHTTRLFRDISGYYHIVVRCDTTQATQADRVRLYVNGVQETSFSTTLYPSQNDDTAICKDVAHFIATDGASSANRWSGIISHFHLCDGYSYGADSFGSTDATTGEWKINTAPSVSYGTTGFFILKDGNSVTDQSGQGNNWTVGAGTLTKTEDCPSNVFATLNPLVRHQGTLDLGNTRFGTTGSWRGIPATIGVSTGKYYWEFKQVVQTNWSQNGIMSSKPSGGYGGIYSTYVGNNSGGLALNSGGGDFYHDGSNNPYGTSAWFSGGLSAGDIISVALDVDASKIWFAKNGTWGNSSNPATGSNGIDFSGDTDFTSHKPYFPACSVDQCECAYNFGNGYFGTTAISSEGTNASGIGKFEYDVPTGYTALSTKGLNE